MLPNAINSPTSKDLARKSIIELAVNVYENARATIANVEYAMGEIERLLADAGAVDENVQALAEQCARDAQAAAENAERARILQAAAARSEENAAANASAAAVEATDARNSADTARSAEQYVRDAENTFLRKPSSPINYHRFPCVWEDNVHYHSFSYAYLGADIAPAIMQWRDNGLGELATRSGRPTEPKHVVNLEYLNERLGASGGYVDLTDTMPSTFDVTESGVYGFMLYSPMGDLCGMVFTLVRDGGGLTAPIYSTTVGALDKLYTIQQGNTIEARFFDATGDVTESAWIAGYIKFVGA